MGIKESMFSVMVELELVFLESLLTQNKDRELTNERVMEHHKTIIYQKLRGNKGIIFDVNISSFLDFEQALANPFIIKVYGVRWHSFVTEHLINDEIMNLFENGEHEQGEGLFLRQRSL